MKKSVVAAFAAALLYSTAASAVDLEVTHWWTSGGEAAAVAEFAKAFDNDGHGDHWVDGAIAGSGGVARPIIISRIIGGDPMGATQLNHGRQAEELIQAGLMQDLTDIATAEHWRDVIGDPKLLDACTYEGKVYCVPVNIHSWHWLWLSTKAFADAGVPTPKDWNEFVADAPALEKAGIVPLAMGQQAWQTNGAFTVLMTAIGGVELARKINADKDAAAAASPAALKVFEAFGAARALSKGSNVQDWNQATNMVITGKAGGQIMGDWAQGEFAVAGKVAGKDYECLPGLGVNPIVSTDGDAFYFPLNKNPDITAAQKRLASLLYSKEVQVAFNLKKGSMPIRTDVDLTNANACMKKGLALLKAGKIVPSTNQLLSPDTQTQLEGLMTEFWNDPNITPAEAQTRYAAIIAKAD